MLMENIYWYNYECNLLQKIKVSTIAKSAET